MKLHRLCVVWLTLVTPIVVQAMGNRGAWPIIHAARSGAEYMARNLIALKVDTNVQDMEGNTALMWAIRGRYCAIVKSLLAVPGINLDMQDDSGNTALIWSVKRDTARVVNNLIDAGANLNLQNAQGDTALITAVCGDKLPKVKDLLRAGADLNLHDTHGMTALMWAAYFGHTQIVEALISASADCYLQDKEGKTALNHALRGECPDTLALLTRAHKASVLQQETNLPDPVDSTHNDYQAPVRVAPSLGLSTDEQSHKSKKRSVPDAQESPAKKQAISYGEDAMKAGAQAVPPADQDTFVTETPAVRLHAAIEQLHSRTQAPEDQRSTLQRKINILFITTALGKSAQFIPYLEQFTPARLAQLRNVLETNKNTGTLIPRLQALEPHAQHVALYILASSNSTLSQADSHLPAILMSYAIVRRAHLFTPALATVTELDTLALDAQQYTDNILTLSEAHFKLLSDYIYCQAETLTQAQIHFLRHELFALDSIDTYGQQLFFEALALGDPSQIAEAIAVLSANFTKN